MNSDNPVPSALTGALNNAARSSFACIDGRGMQCCMGGSIGVGESVWVQLCMHVALVDVGCIGTASHVHQAKLLRAALFSAPISVLGTGLSLFIDGFS
ncbi:hypothetical protein V6N13_141063 [Hibiscus sabdariffa]|uniref:Uncharacterized protein n=1 Tax=Hibiscus sabdariffa TaxID=183260 RepID=A0ABR2Q111_9ROSI